MGGAIVDNQDSVEKMHAAIWVTFYHSISTDQQHYHYRCPEGAESWCFFQKAVANGEQPPRHRDHPTHTFLAHDVAQKMVAVYKRMSDHSLLQRLLHGGTQNNNECLTAQIWLRCPKTVFMGRKRVEGAVARAVSIFNEGATELVAIMNKLWVDVSLHTLQKLAKGDEKRMSKADAAATRQFRNRRKKQAVRHRVQLRAEANREGEVYGPGIAE